MTADQQFAASPMKNHIVSTFGRGDTYIVPPLLVKSQSDGYVNCGTSCFSYRTAVGKRDGPMDMAQILSLFPASDGNDCSPPHFALDVEFIDQPLAAA